MQVDFPWQRERSYDRSSVVDDEPPILRALAITLTARDYDVVTAANGAEVSRPWRRDHPAS